MLKRCFAVLLFVLLIISCKNSKEKARNYRYVELVKKESIVGGFTNKEGEAKIISAVTDSLAYIEAYTLFCTSLKVHDDLTKKLGKLSSSPISFKLLNESDIDISKTVYIGENTKKMIMESIFSLGTLQETTIKADPKSETIESRIDSNKIKELKKLFIAKNDEFSSNNTVWYKPKSAPQYINRNGIYCYFQYENGRPTNLRFSVQYYADEWLFFHKLQFSIDGKAYEYIPYDIKTDHDGGHVWEWFDQGLTPSDKNLIYALANAKNAKIKFIGSKYYDIKTVTAEQIKGIKNTIDFYTALGGNY